MSRYRFDGYIDDRINFLSNFIQLVRERFYVDRKYCISDFVLQLFFNFLDTVFQFTECRGHLNSPCQKDLLPHNVIIIAQLSKATVSLKIKGLKR
jgi:hypothetical protein